MNHQYQWLIDKCSGEPVKVPFKPKPKKERCKQRMLLYQKRKIIEKMYGNQVLNLENPKAMKR